MRFKYVNFLQLLRIGYTSLEFNNYTNKSLDFIKNSSEQLPFNSTNRLFFLKFCRNMYYYII